MENYGMPLIGGNYATSGRQNPLLTTFILQEIFGPGSPEITDEDCSAVRYICECVSRRAGFMAAAGITALLKKMDYKDVVSAKDSFCMTKISS